MPFELRIDKIDANRGTIRVSGRLLKGCYFGPEIVEITLRDGTVFQTPIGGTSVDSPESWPVLPQHDSVLYFELPGCTHGQLVVGMVLRGIGFASSEKAPRQPSNELLDVPLFWAMHYLLLIGDESHDESELCQPLFGILSKDVNQFYVDRFTAQSGTPLWRYFSIPLDDSRFIEIEYADAAPEYQTRYKLGDSVGAITVGYDSGHFSLPSLRWPELLHIASKCPSSLEKARTFLLLFPGIYVNDSEEKDASRELQSSFESLRLFQGSGLSILARNIARNRRNTCTWTHHEKLGWICNGQYAQRNPTSLLSSLAENDFIRIKQFFDVK